jgi:hypothetical protein
MSDRQNQNSGSSGVRAGLALDEARLARWMADNVDGYTGPLSLEQFNGGQSNPTYKLVTPGKNYVLRRKPPGQLVAGAHAVDREYRVITALAKAGFPVAATHGFCADEDVVGSSFFVMDCVDGRIFWDARFPDVPVAERASCSGKCDASCKAQSGSATMASLAIISRGRSRVGPASMSRMSMPVVSPTWTVLLHGCLRTSRRARTSRSSMATIAATI